VLSSKISDLRKKNGDHGQEMGQRAVEKSICIPYLMSCGFANFG